MNGIKHNSCIFHEHKFFSIFKNVLTHINMLLKLVLPKNITLFYVIIKMKQVVIFCILNN